MIIFVIFLIHSTLFALLYFDSIDNILIYVIYSTIIYCIIALGILLYLSYGNLNERTS